MYSSVTPTITAFSEAIRTSVSCNNAATLSSSSLRVVIVPAVLNLNHPLLADDSFDSSPLSIV